MAIDVKNDLQAKELLKSSLLIFYPDEYIKEFIRSPKDIYDYRVVLRDIEFTNASLRYLVQMVVEAIKHNKRFRTLGCLIVLKSIVYSAKNSSIDKDIVDKLFYLFQHFVFSSNTEVQRHANNLIRGRALDEKQITWLIKRWRKSQHILNRLLRYPEANEQITAWANGIYAHNELPDRAAEVLSILVTDLMPEFHADEDINTILWAIYYSKNTEEIKEQLLLNFITENNITECADNIIKIAMRLKNGGRLLQGLVARYC